MKNVSLAPFVVLQTMLLLSTCSNHTTSEGIFADIVTTRGTMVAKLDYVRAPLMCMQFIGLTQGTLFNTYKRAEEPFYADAVIHRADKEYIKTGAPHGDEKRDPGYLLPDQFIPGFLHDKPGIVTMSRIGMQFIGSTGLGMQEPNTVGSQFFITRTAAPQFNNWCSPFGSLIEGFEVLNALGVGDKIISINIRRVGKRAQAFTVNQKRFYLMQKL